MSQTDISSTKTKDAALDTDVRLARLEKRLAEFDALLEYLMLLAAQHPAGRKLLKLMAKGSKP